MDAARSFIALGPLAIYLLVLGAINFFPRPFLTTGLRDLAALGLAVCGLVLVGPVELFAPTQVIAKMGVVFWLSILGFYVSSVTLLLLLLPPRLVVYNMKAEQLRPVLSRVASVLGFRSPLAGRRVAPSKRRRPACHAFVQLHAERGSSFHRRLASAPGLAPIGSRIAGRARRNTSFAQSPRRHAHADRPADRRHAHHQLGSQSPGRGARFGRHVRRLNHAGRVFPLFRPWQNAARNPAASRQRTASLERQKKNYFSNSCVVVV